MRPSSAEMRRLHERNLPVVQARLGADAFDPARVEGRAMTAEEAIDEAFAD